MGFCLVSVCKCAALSATDVPHLGSVCDTPKLIGNDFRVLDWTLWSSLGSVNSDSAAHGILDHTYPLDFGNTTLTSQRSALRFRRSAGDTPTRTVRRQEEDRASLDLRPTPQPTGDPSDATTVYIASAADFAILLPGINGELISDAENDGVSYCTSDSAEGSCADRPRLPVGFITAAAMKESDDGSWIQVTGCLDNSKFHLDPSDAGGQFDVRFPNGAQCAFGGYGASFIELVEPALSRFCIRCCSTTNDQTHCNSHQDRLGCTTAIPGQYDFPDLGISCS
ncbi:hypothetical protein BC629DRAFT_1290008 [Irpex lacteus]|nr:hypothetical protein BC629DRAFT_1290008 [Irpex lacteus]